MRRNQSRIRYPKKKSSRQRYLCRRCGSEVFLVLRPEGGYLAADAFFRGKTPTFRGEQLYDRAEITPHVNGCLQNPRPVGWLRATFDGRDVFTRGAWFRLLEPDELEYQVKKGVEYAEGKSELLEIEERERRSVGERRDSPDMGRMLDQRGVEDAAMSGGGYLDWCDRKLGPGNPCAIPDDMGEDFTLEDLRGDESSANQTAGPIADEPDF